MEFDNLINKIENLNHKFPNLCALWKNYLILKKKHLEKQIDACNIMFSMIEKDGTDITIPTFMILYMIYND